MRRLVAAALTLGLFLYSQRALAGYAVEVPQHKPELPPAWMVRGYEAALADPQTIRAVVQLRYSTWLSSAIPPGPSADEALDKLLSLIEIESEPSPGIVADAFEAVANLPLGARSEIIVERAIAHLKMADASASSAARALAKIPVRTHIEEAVNTLIPLLKSNVATEKEAAAEALTKLIPLAPNPKEAVGRLIPILSSERDAIDVVATIPLGDASNEVIDKLLSLLGSRSWQSEGAATALGKISLGNRSNEVIDKLLERLTKNSENAGEAAQALANIPLGDRSSLVIDRLVPLLEKSSPDEAVAKAISKLPLDKHSSLVIHKLLDLFEKDQGIRVGLIEALSAIPLGSHSKEVLDKLFSMLSSQSYEKRVRATLALSRVPLGERSAEALKRLLPMLDDPEIGGHAAAALINIPLGEHTGEVIDKLILMLDFIYDDQSEFAAWALKQLPLGDRSEALVQKLQTKLTMDRLGEGGEEIMLAAAFLPNRSEEMIIKVLTPILVNPESRKEDAAAEALTKAGPGGVRALLPLLEYIHDQAASEKPRLRALAHIITGADTKHEGSEVLLAWLGKPESFPPIENSAAAHQYLSVFAQHWWAIFNYPSLRQEAEEKVTQIVHLACATPVRVGHDDHWSQNAASWIWYLIFQGPVHRCWSAEQLRILEYLAENFDDGGYKDGLRAYIAQDKVTGFSMKFLPIALSWIAFWGAFLVAFPWSRTVQAIFFWNPRIRNILSLWFIPIMLLCIPPLRRRLLIPFQADLTAAARLNEIQRLAFFGESRVRIGSGSPIMIQAALDELTGVAVLRGDAGLGKTSALRWVAARAKRPVVFLTAHDCRDGVDVAISRLIHQIQDTGFVRSLVYTGALTVSALARASSLLKAFAAANASAA
jgi:hypothetical protein